MCLLMKEYTTYYPGNSLAEKKELKYNQAVNYQFIGSSRGGSNIADNGDAISKIQIMGTRIFQLTNYKGKKER